jgi:GTPase KRas
MKDQNDYKASGFLITYSIHSKQSFEKVVDKIEFVLRLKDADHFPMVLIGNKCDLEE